MIVEQLWATVEELLNSLYHFGTASSVFSGIGDCHNSWLETLGYL
jgi:hypothetical protein